MEKKVTYLDSGVDIDAADQFVEKTVVPLAHATLKGAPIKTLTSIGSFASYVDLQLPQYEDPVLAVTTDGVGTKVQIARMARKYRGIGIDLVAMCVNDLIVGGATPVLFLDYLATSTFDRLAMDELMVGIAEGCTLAGAALVGGETAHMPGHYSPGDFDVAGFAVGIAERKSLTESAGGKAALQSGDAIVGIASTGIHSNGYSLVRKLCFEERRLDLSRPADPTRPGLRRPLGEILLEPTAIYVREAKALRKACRVRGMAHITGSGVSGNLPRIYSDQVAAEIDLSTWALPAIFQLLQEWSGLSDAEMLGTFNCGIGMIAVVPSSEARQAIEAVSGCGRQAFEIGKIVERKGSMGPVQYLKSWRR